MSHPLITPLSFTELIHGKVMAQQPPQAFTGDVYDVTETTLYHEREPWIYPLDHFEGNPTQSENYLTPMQRVEAPGAKAEKFLITLGALAVGVVLLDGYLGGTILNSF